VRGRIRHGRASTPRQAIDRSVQWILTFVRMTDEPESACVGKGGSRNDPTRNRCGCFLPDLTKLATTPSARLPAWQIGDALADDKGMTDRLVSRAMTRRTASCSCGALAAACEGDPVRVSVCHCLDCQKRSGSAFAVQARFPEERVAIAGEWREWMRIGDEGSHARFRFCPTCSSIVFYVVDEIPGFVTIPVGGFADPAFPAPSVCVYDERRHPWVALVGEDIRHEY